MDSIVLAIFPEIVWLSRILESKAKAAEWSELTIYELRWSHTATFSKHAVQRYGKSYIHLFLLVGYQREEEYHFVFSDVTWYITCYHKKRYDKHAQYL